MFLKSKRKGIALSLEFMATMVIVIFITWLCVYVIKSSQLQKVMYNSLISAVTETSKWGGTDTVIYKTQNKTGMSIVDNMKAEIKRATGYDVTLTVTPAKISAGSNTITGKITWKDYILDYGALEFGGRTHTLTVKTDSIVSYGTLYSQ